MRSVPACQPAAARVRLLAAGAVAWATAVLLAAAPLADAQSKTAAGKTAAARTIDRQMVAHAKTVIAYLKKYGYHDVGILKFRVQYAGKPSTFAAGGLNVAMTERLENALVLNLEEKDGIRVLHDAGNVIAARGENLSYLRSADVKKLFAGKYPVAWGKEQMRPDVFLTGLVKVSTDAAGRPKSAEVAVHALDASAQWGRVATFSTSIDSTLYADLGLSRRAKKGYSLRAFDDDEEPKFKDDEPKSKDEPKTKDDEPKTKDDEPKTKDDVEKETVKDPKKEEFAPAKNPQESLVKFTVFYGDRRLEPAYNPDKPGKETLEEPKESKQRVRFKVQNQAKENVGLALLVNGLSTLDREVKKDPRLYRMWILEPGIEYDIDGYYLSKSGSDKSDVQPFRTFADDEWNALAVDLPAPGQIQLLVFVSRKVPPIADPKKDPPPSDPDMKISNRTTLRGLGNTKALENRRELTLAKLKFALNQASNRVVPRGGFAPGDPGYEQVLEYSQLPNPTLVEQRFIQYWTPKTTK